MASSRSRPPQLRAVHRFRVYLLSSGLEIGYKMRFRLSKNVRAAVCRSRAIESAPPGFREDNENNRIEGGEGLHQTVLENLNRERTVEGCIDQQKRADAPSYIG